MYVTEDPLTFRFKLNMKQNYKDFKFQPDLAFYCWFYSVIQPTEMKYTIVMRKHLNRIFQRDILLLLKSEKSFIDALSTLCTIRKFTSTTAWKLFYVRYKKDKKCGKNSSWLDDEDFQGKHKPFISSFDPRGRRFSLRLLGIDPSFNKYFGMYGARGCFHCAYSYTGCISCLEHNQLKPHHYMKLVLGEMENCAHVKCNNHGCNTCLHMTRKQARVSHFNMFRH